MPAKGGADVLTLRWEDTHYVHLYKYTGELDLWFLNNYDIIALRDCNEYSVELVRTALNLWDGNKIIFIGENWKYIIDELPDIDGKECIWEDTLTDEELREFSNGAKYLDVRFGIPYEEKMDRYYNNIMTYDEVMAFTFLFADKRNLGNKNPDKRFFVVNALYGQLGLFATFYKALSLARYVKKKGFIPLMHITNEFGENSIYQDFDGDEFWEKFFNQPEEVDTKEVLESRNVYFSPCFYNARILQTIMDSYSEGVDFSWKDGIYSKNIHDYIERRKAEFMPFPNETLGVLARGTDIAVSKPVNHAVHASKEMIADKIDALLSEWGLKYVFIATEDADYYEYFRERFGDKAYFTDQKRYRITPGEWLAEMHRNDSNKIEGWKLGADYILALYLLSIADSFMASGACSGVGEAKKMNNGKWRNEFVFDLGINR